MTLYLLDSDHLSLYQRGYEPLMNYFLRIPPDQIFISIISVEELLRGRLAQVKRGVKPGDRVQAYYWFFKTIDFICGFNMLEYGAQAEAYFQKLRSQKIRIGTQDLKIAAIALSNRAVLVTRNIRDFQQIHNLETEDWSIVL